MSFSYFIFSKTVVLDNNTPKISSIFGKFQSKKAMLDSVSTEEKSFNVVDNLCLHQQRITSPFGLALGVVVNNNPTTSKSVVRDFKVIETPTVPHYVDTKKETYKQILEMFSAQL